LFYHCSCNVTYILLVCWFSFRGKRLKQYVTSRKVAGSIPDEVFGFILFVLNLPAALWP
jgi:hypothetical protein